MLLEACVASGSTKDGARRGSLVFGVCDMFYVSGPAGATGAADIALALSRAAVEALVDNRGPMGPGVAGLRVVLAVAQSNHQIGRV